VRDRVRVAAVCKAVLSFVSAPGFIGSPSSHHRTVKLPCLALLTAGRPPDNSNALETSLDRLGAPVLIGESRRTTPVEVGVRAPHLLLAPLSFFCFVMKE